MGIKEYEDRLGYELLDVQIFNHSRAGSRDWPISALDFFFRGKVFVNRWMVSLMGSPWSYFILSYQGVRRIGACESQLPGSREYSQP